MDPAFKAAHFKKCWYSKISNKLIFQATYTYVCATSAREINNVTRYMLTRTLQLISK